MRNNFRFTFIPATYMCITWHAAFILSNISIFNYITFYENCFMASFRTLLSHSIASASSTDDITTRGSATCQLLSTCNVLDQKQINICLKTYLWKGNSWSLYENFYETNLHRQRVNTTLRLHSAVLVDTELIEFC